MAAIGALYEMEQVQSKDLFESAKKMIQLYLEERRKADVRKADHRKAGVDHGPRLPENSVHTPVWLVQAMLLNVVYGHNCGDSMPPPLLSLHFPYGAEALEIFVWSFWLCFEALRKFLKALGAQYLSKTCANIMFRDRRRHCKYSLRCLGQSRSSSGVIKAALSTGTEPAGRADG